MKSVADKTVTTTPLDDLQNSLVSPLGRVNALIAERMHSHNAPRIPEVTAHLVDAGGKRVRPILTLASAGLTGYTGEKDAHLAAAVEFIHTATLLHDDVVDESAQRRGRPTANLLWDNKSSVLVGDYLFSRAFQLMVETGSIRILEILANASATIAEGEVLQLSCARQVSTGYDTYLSIIRGKTAALFSAACEAGGVLSDAPGHQVKALFDYGDALGIAFQIVDDVLDYGGVSQTLGKNTGDDFRERKMTLPVIRSLAQAGSEERAFWTRTIQDGDQREGDVETAIAYLHQSHALRDAKAEALDWAERAKTSLDALPDHPLRDQLSSLADFVVARIV
jgi:octaprenyl-diphosphate synthase